MDLVGNTFFFDWEISLIVWLQAHMGAFGTALASFISAFGEELACVAVIGFLYWCYDKRFGRFVGLNVLVGIVLNPMIKNIFVRRIGVRLDGLRKQILFFFDLLALDLFLFGRIGDLRRDRNARADLHGHRPLSVRPVFRPVVTDIPSDKLRAARRRLIDLFGFGLRAVLTAHFRAR